MLALPTTGQERGIDLGLESFATVSDGTRVLTPACYRKAERQLRRLQRCVSRRKKWGHRRRKAVQLLAKTHLTVRRWRRDFHHKTALALVRQNDTIYHEASQTCRPPKAIAAAKGIRMKADSRLGKQRLRGGKAKKTS
jgi:putative transposase